MKYENTDYVTSFYIEFEPVSYTILKDIREMINEFLDDQGIELITYETGFLTDNKTKDMFD